MGRFDNNLHNWSGNVSQMLQNPLSSSTGGLLGGSGGIVNLDTGGSGVKNNSLQGGLSNQNNRYGALAIGTYLNGSVPFAAIGQASQGQPASADSGPPNTANPTADAIKAKLAEETKRRRMAGLLRRR